MSIERDPESKRLLLNLNALNGFVLSMSLRETLVSRSPYGLYAYDAVTLPASSE